MNIPPDDALLSEVELSALYTAMGAPLSVATLATKRCRGGGPPFVKFERIVRYRWAEARDWRLSSGRRLRNTSEDPHRRRRKAPPAETATVVT
jgi:hypothetical protein